MSLRSIALSAALCSFFGATSVLSQTMPAQALTIASAFEQTERRHGELFTLDVMLGTYAVVTGLNELWLFDEAGALEDRASVAIEGEEVTFAWSTGESFTVPLDTSVQVRFSGEISPLATQVAILLTSQTAKAVAGLPKGASFEASGELVNPSLDLLGHWDLTSQGIELHVIDQEPKTVSLTSLLPSLEEKPAQ